VCGVVLNITYGHKVDSITDPLVVNGDKATSNTVNIGGPGSLLVDLIPIRMFSWFSDITQLQLTAFFGRSETLANLDAVFGFQEARRVYTCVSR